MKFAHLADCHIGSWRDPKLREVSVKAFIKAIDSCIEKQVDFILISGDLFNTSLPAIDKLQVTVQKLKELKDMNIPVYMIAGSHDFSPSGKTMLDVLESAGLIINVVKGEIEDNKLKLNFTIDQKTGAKITGMLGKKGMLEKKYYEDLIRSNLESEPGFKIFMFHTAITELKPSELEKMESAPVSLLPKDFSYYAGGHVHIVEKQDLPGYRNLIYPGPIFPNSFSELEKLGNGGYYLYDNDSISYEPIIIYNTFSVSIDCENLTPEQVEEELRKEFKDKEFPDTIITIKLKGILLSGKTADIDFKTIFESLYEKGAYFVMKNTSQLSSKDFKEIKVDTSDADDIEADIIKEHIGQIKVEDLSLEKEEQLTKDLIRSLNSNKQEGERVADFEARIKAEVNRILEID